VVLLKLLTGHLNRQAAGVLLMDLFVRTKARYSLIFEETFLRA
jgi:hypothetical protein